MSTCTYCDHPARYRVWWKPGAAGTRRMSSRPRIAAEVCDDHLDEAHRTAARWPQHGTSLLDQPENDGQDALFDIGGDGR